MRNSKWRIQYAGHFLLNSIFFLFKLHKNENKEIFEVADYVSEVKNEKFKMADSIWRPILNDLDVFLPSRLKMNCIKSIYKEFSD